VTATLLMSAEQVHADRAGWLARRTRDWDGHWCVTASEIAGVCGLAPRSWPGPYALWHKKLMGEETTPTAEMRRGTALEPIVLAEFADDHPELVLLPGGLYCHPDMPWLVATLDGQAVETDTARALGIPTWDSPAELAMVPGGLAALAGADVSVVEAKTTVPTDAWGPEDSDEVPAHIRAQVLIQMWVRGAARAYVAVKPVASWGPTVPYVIDMTDRARAEVAWMILQAEDFTKRLATGKPPPVDWYPASTTTLHRQFPGSDIDPDAEVRIPWRLANQFRRGLAAEGAVKDRRTLAKNRMLQRAGHAGTIVTFDPATGRKIKVATRTSGPMPERHLDAIPHVDRLNPCSWSKRQEKS
jgi:putative phage-type endonuclease